MLIAEVFLEPLFFFFFLDHSWRHTALKYTKQSSRMTTTTKLKIKLQPVRFWCWENFTVFSFFENAKPWIIQNIPFLVHAGREEKFYHKLIRSQIFIISLAYILPPAPPPHNFALISLCTFYFPQISGQQAIGRGKWKHLIKSPGVHRLVLEPPLFLIVWV